MIQVKKNNLIIKKKSKNLNKNEFFKFIYSTKTHIKLGNHRLRCPK